MEPRPEYAPTNKPLQKPWYCLGCMHQLGTVYRNGSGLRKLRVEHEKLVVTIVMGATIDCPVCGNSREWVPGEEALQELIDRRSGKLV